MKKDIEDTKEERKSLAMQFVDTLKEQNKRLFLCWVITFAAFIGLISYTIYALNDLAIIETTEITQESDTGYNNYIGNDGEIVNGETNDKEK